MNGLNYGMVLQWNLSWETTFMRDHLSWKTTHFWQKDQHFNTTEPVTRDHLSWETTFLWPKGWSFKTGSTVLCQAVLLVYTVALVLRLSASAILSTLRKSIGSGSVAPSSPLIRALYWLMLWLMLFWISCSFWTRPRVWMFHVWGEESKKPYSFNSMINFLIIHPQNLPIIYHWIYCIINPPTTGRSFSYRTITLAQLFTQKQ